MKKLIKEREDIAFYIKLIAKPAAMDRAKSIVCERSMRVLERAYDGGDLQPARCTTDEVEKNVEWALSYGLTGTPIIVLPDGGVVTGYKDAMELASRIDASVKAMQTPIPDAEASGGGAEPSAKDREAAAPKTDATAAPGGNQ